MTAAVVLMFCSLLTTAYTWLTYGVTGPGFNEFLREDADARSSYSVYAPNWKVDS